MRNNWIFVLMLMVTLLMAPVAFAQEPVPDDGFSFTGPSDWTLKAMVTLSATTEGGDIAAGSGMAMTYGPVAKWNSGGSALVEVGVLEVGLGVSDGVDDRDPMVASLGGGLCAFSRVACVMGDHDVTNGEWRAMLLLTPDLRFLK